MEKQPSRLIVTNLPSHSHSPEKAQKGHLSMPLIATILALVTLSVAACGWWMINREPTRDVTPAAAQQYDEKEITRSRMPSHPGP